MYKIQGIKKHGYAGKGLQAKVGMRWMGQVIFSTFALFSFYPLKKFFLAVLHSKTPLHWKCEILTTGLPGKSLPFSKKKKIKVMNIVLFFFFFN